MVSVPESTEKSNPESGFWASLVQSEYSQGLEEYTDGLVGSKNVGTDVKR